MQTEQLAGMIESTKEDLKKQLQYALFSLNYNQSLQIVNKMIDIDAQNMQNHKTKTTIFFNLNRYKQCIQSAQLPIEKGQKSIQFFNMIIKAHLQLNNIQLAQGLMEQVIVRNQPLKEFLDLKETVEKIKEEDAYKLPEEEIKILKQMKQWLYPKGANYDKVKVVTQKKGYRGAIATKSIKKDQTIVFIPKSQLLTLQSAKQIPISKQILKKNIQLLSPKHSIMSVYLLEEITLGKSKYKPYLDILPKDHSCFPINFSTEELTELIGSPFLFQIQQKVFDLKRDYDAICYGSQQFFKKYSFKDFCWARMMVGSRVFGVFIDGVKTQILAPFADMLNHKTPKQTVWNYSQQRSGFFIKSLKDINIGDELFDSYGRKCNSRFLLNYGFVMQKNDRNQICIKIDFDEKDPNYEKKLYMLKLTQDFKISKVFRITKLIEQNSFFQLMGYLRFKNIEKIETLNVLQKISTMQKSHEPYNPFRTPPTSMQVELKIWSDLRNSCQNYLNDYATTLQQDEERLKNDKKLTENMRNILILRIGQKRLYKHYFDISQKVIDILSKGYTQARQETKNQLDKDYCRYIQKILYLMPHEKNDLLKKGQKNPTPQLLQEPEYIKSQLQLQEDDQISREY